MTSTGWAERQKNLISDLKTYNDTDHYGAYFYSPSDHGTSHTYVVAPNGDAVAVTSTINFYFYFGFSQKPGPRYAQLGASGEERGGSHWTNRRGKTGGSG